MICWNLTILCVITRLTHKYCIHGLNNFIYAIQYCLFDGVCIPTTSEKVFGCLGFWRWLSLSLCHLHSAQVVQLLSLTPTSLVVQL